jgi:hypothetical protein
MAQFRLKRLKYSALFPNTRVFGFEEIMDNLNREIENIQGASMRGLIKAAAHIRQKTESDSPRTPVDYGNLRASWFVTTATGVHAGSGTSGFRDNPEKKMTAGDFATNHQATVTEAQGIVTSQTTKDKKVLMMGYSANYALWVHEAVDKKFKREGSGAKWLQTAIGNNTKTILEIIRQNAQIK